MPSFDDEIRAFEQRERRERNAPDLETVRRRDAAPSALPGAQAEADRLLAEAAQTLTSRQVRGTPIARVRPRLWWGKGAVQVGQHWPVRDHQMVVTDDGRLSLFSWGGLVVRGSGLHLAQTGSFQSPTTYTRIARAET